MLFSPNSLLNNTILHPHPYKNTILNFIPGCSDLSGFHAVDHAVFANVSGANCDAGIWDGTADGRNQVRHSHLLR